MIYPILIICYITHYDQCQFIPVWCIYALLVKKMPKNKSKSKKYTLINPHLEGGKYADGMCDIKARSSDEAADLVFRRLSKIIAEPLERQNFTLTDDSGNMTHFVAIMDSFSKKNEDKKDSKTCKYAVYRLPSSLPSNVEDSLMSRYNKSKEDEDEDDEEEEEEEDEDHVKMYGGGLDSDLDNIMNDKVGRIHRPSRKYVSPDLQKYTYYHLPYHLIDLTDLGPAKRHTLTMPVFLFPIIPIMSFCVDIY